MIKAGCISGRGGYTNKGNIPPIWTYVVAVVLFGLMPGFAGVSRADEIHAAEAQKRPAAAAIEGQKQAGEEMNGDKAGGPAKTEEAVVAKVNGVPITRGSLERMVTKFAQETAAQEKKVLEEIDRGELREKALDRLIFQELVYQRARHEGIKADQKDIDAAMDKMKAQAGGEEAYRKFLEGISKTEDDARAAVERSLTMELIYKREISDKITVSEDDVKREYEREKDKFVIPEVVSVIDVIFFLDAGKAESFKKAEELREKIVGDKDKNPWNLVPDGTFVVRELAIKKATDEELYKEARKLKEGELSGVIKTNDSLHLIQLKKYSPENRLTFEQMKTFVERKLISARKQELIKKWDEELRKGAKIEIMVSEKGK